MIKEEVLNFENRFDKEIKEVIVLTQSSAGASRGGKDILFQADVSVLAYVDIQEDQVIKKDTRLTWLLTDEECRTKEKIFNIDGEKIYYLKVRESLPTGELHGGWELMVVEVVEQDYKESRLEELLNEYKKPVTIQIDGCSELLLDKYLGMFTGECQWNGEQCRVHLDIDEKGMETAEDATETLLNLLDSSKSWDDQARAFAAFKLVGLANEWQEDEDYEDEWQEDEDEDEEDSEWQEDEGEEDDVLEITEDEFAKRIHISELSISTDGDFEIYYDDDDMFLGHVIIVSGNIKEGFEDASIAG